jgi:heme/copper-type cytochrome/quinol oxidase subunit 2
LLADVSVRAAFNIPAAPTAVVQPPVTQQAPQAETPHDEDGLTPAAREGLNGIQIALVVIIVVAFVVFVGLVSVIIMQRKAIKRLTGGVSLEYSAIAMVITFIDINRLARLTWSTLCWRNKYKNSFRGVRTAELLINF